MKAIALMSGLMLGSVLLLASGNAHADAAAGLADLRDARYGEAVAEWKASAESGDAVSALLLGVISDIGQGVPQDYAQALYWYKRAAEAGSPSGMFNVGIMYDGGQGVPQDQAEAARWYGRAAAAGFARAEYNLALMYETGSGVPRDRDRAIRLFRSAEEHGLMAAARHLAQLGGRRVPRVTAQPARQASRDDVAMEDFRRAQSAMLERTPAEAQHAALLFRRVAQNHDAAAQYAQYDLGYCYENGRGVQQDKLQAYVWFLRSGSSGGDPSVKAIAISAARNLETQLAPMQVEQARKQVASEQPVQGTGIRSR